MTTTIAPVGRHRKPAEPIAPLSLGDSCDACGYSTDVVSVNATAGTYVSYSAAISRAFVQVTKGTDALLFCAHHYAEHELALMQAGWVLAEDHREKINSKPASGSAFAG